VSSSSPSPTQGASFDNQGPAHCLFRLSTLTREVTFAAISEADAMQWVKDLKTYKERAIKELLGHLKRSPHQRAVFDSGNSLLKKGSEKVRKEWEERLETTQPYM